MATMSYDVINLAISLSRGWVIMQNPIFYILISKYCVILPQSWSKCKMHFFFKIYNFPGLQTLRKNHQCPIKIVVILGRNGPSFTECRLVPILVIGVIFS